MKIGIFSDRYLPLSDGICTSIETFRLELEKLGHEVYVFAPKPSWRFKAPSDRIIFFTAIKGLFFDDYLTSFFFPPQALKQIDQLKLDIIHYQTPGPIGLLGAYYALRKKIPLVTTYHTDLFEYVKHYPAVLPGTIGLSLLAPVITGGNMDEYRNALSSIRPERNVDKWNQKIVVRGLTLIHNHCDLVITPSIKIQKQLASWGTKSKLEVLPTGVDKITTTSQEIEIVRAKYGLSVSDHVLIFVGRIGTEKNIGLLIKAFDHIGRQDDLAKLLIIGDGDDVAQFKEQAATSQYGNRIIFTGWIQHEQLGAYYDSACLFVSASLTETQGLSTNEAAWAGLPIVIVDPEVSEVVADGENGFIAKVSARDLASKILKILKNDVLRSNMSTRSVEYAGNFTAGKQAAKLLRLYEATIEKHTKDQSTKKRPSRRELAASK
jgi:1,2-diacylglycerol 3-alpha-glucosyltransferase